MECIVLGFAWYSIPLRVRTNMNTTRMIIGGILLAAMPLSGLWVSNNGRPLNSAVYNVHKITSVVTIVLIGITIYNLNKTVTIEGLPLIFTVATGLLFLALIATAGFLSFERPLPAYILMIHRIAPLLAIASSAITIYLLVNGKA